MMPPSIDRSNPDTDGNDSDDDDDGYNDSDDDDGYRECNSDDNIDNNQISDTDGKRALHVIR